MTKTIWARIIETPTHQIVVSKVLTHGEDEGYGVKMETIWGNEIVASVTASFGGDEDAQVLLNIKPQFTETKHADA